MKKIIFPYRFQKEKKVENNPRIPIIKNPEPEDP